MRRSRWVPMAVAATAAAVVGGFALSGGGAAAPATKPVAAALVAASSKTTAKFTPFPKMTGAQIRLKELAALQTAKSVHVQGTVVSLTRLTGSTVTTKETYNVDLHVGPNAFGTMSNADGVLSVRRLGTNLFLAPDDRYIAAQGHPELVTALHGKWIKVLPTDADYASIAQLTYITTWTKLMASVPATSRKPGGTFAGIPTVAIYKGSGPEVTTLYIAAKGAALPAYAITTNKANKLAFFHWNWPVGVDAPDAGSVVSEPAALDVSGSAGDTAAAFEHHA